MLEKEMLEQLKEVFSKLENPVDLIYDSSKNENQTELVNMLEAVASTSDLISIKKSGQESSAPRFTLFNKDKPTGIFFRGTPGGHEFTSLILAVLNSDGKGKLPDEGLSRRIQALKGPLRIKTFVSLTCENCPDVVQALNQMALSHDNFEHETIDGAYAQDEVESLGIQGVPSVITGSELLHSGRIHFLELLTKLETHFGSESVDKTGPAKDLGKFDVVVLGGGPAGASAAIYSARKGLKTALVAERMGGQVKDTKGIENLISVTYTEGPQLADQLYKHVKEYPIEVLDQRRVSRLEKNKTIQLEGGESLSGESVIITTGAKWRELGVPGEKEYIGRGVAYCPHCDGPFYKGKTIAVVGGGNSGIEAAIDLAGIAGNVTVFEFAKTLKADQILIDKLNSLPNTNVVTNARTTELVGDGKKIVSLKYVDRQNEKETDFPIDGVFVQIGLIPNSSFANETIELSKHGEIIIDEKCRTNVEGIYAAGDVTTTPYKQIIIAMGEGAKASLAAFEDRMRKQS